MKTAFARSGGCQSVGIVWFVERASADDPESFTGLLGRASAAS